MYILLCSLQLLPGVQWFFLREVSNRMIWGIFLRENNKHMYIIKLAQDRIFLTWCKLNRHCGWKSYIEFLKRCRVLCLFAVIRNKAIWNNELDIKIMNDLKYRLKTVGLWWWTTHLLPLDPESTVVLVKSCDWSLLFEDLLRLLSPPVH